MAPLDDELSAALMPWRGQWFVPPPAPGWRVASMAQVTAKRLLRYGERLTNWDAKLLQTVLSQDRKADDAQLYWLNRIEEAVGEREAA